MSTIPPSHHRPSGGFPLLKNSLRWNGSQLMWQTRMPQITVGCCVEVNWVSDLDRVKGEVEGSNRAHERKNINPVFVIDISDLNANRNDIHKSFEFWGLNFWVVTWLIKFIIIIIDLLAEKLTIMLLNQIKLPIWEIKLYLSIYYTYNCAVVVVKG